MPKPTPLSDDERNNLIAFLDGELDEDDSRLWEARIQTEPSVRAEAELLRRTWSLLDHLPKPEPTAAFASRTVERISAVRPTAGLESRDWRAWAVGASWAAAVIAALFLGYFAARPALRPTPKPGNDLAEVDPNEMARDLRILEHLQEYELAESVDFLLALDHADLFGDDR